MIDTVEGAKASAIVFSLVETAKANGLKVYEYLTYLLFEIPKHMDQFDLSFVDNLLPWSESLPTLANNTNSSRGHLVWMTSSSFSAPVVYRLPIRRRNSAVPKDSDREYARGCIPVPSRSGRAACA